MGVSRLFGVVFLHGNGVEGLIKARSWDDTLFICFLLEIFVFGSIDSQCVYRRVLLFRLRS